MTAATAAGLALSNQFAGAFFGMMQAAMAATATTEQRQAADDKLSGAVKDAGRSDEVRTVASHPVAMDVASDASQEVSPSTSAPSIKLRAKSKQKVSETQGVPKPAKVGPGKPTASQDPLGGSRRRSSRTRKQPDDLKAISGIGPKLEVLLNGMGVVRIEDIAAWTDKEVEHFDREVGLDGRIAKDDWIAQAKALLR
ncbi:5' DNA nuclease [Rhizobium lemnae]|uniref:5' DNA nuclease n=1 Tax=Rhizobium lemnae TaxID=1214924 RepID=A0ABV8E837_9HYPH|nr:5' DNA nuclease [Rhizobium lemnae]MCJ8508396.1 5' DNA nuclease [Rhizobium lemnae]